MVRFKFKKERCFIVAEAPSYATQF